MIIESYIHKILYRKQNKPSTEIIYSGFRRSNKLQWSTKTFRAFNIYADSYVIFSLDFKNNLYFYTLGLVFEILDLKKIEYALYVYRYSY